MRRIVLALLGCATIAAQQPAKDKEAVVMVQRQGDKAQERILDSGKQLANKLTKDGFDVDTVVMGDLPHGMDIASLDDLKSYLQGKLKNACYKSIHFVTHGSPSDSGLTGMVFPPDSNGSQVVVRGENGAAAIDDQPRDFGKANFAGVIDAVLCPDGEAYLESCWSAKNDGPSLAQRLADELGRKVHGHTGLVKFEEGLPPEPDHGDTLVSAGPTTPSATYGGSGERYTTDGKGHMKTQPGRTYQWVIQSNLKGICDVHIQLPKGTNVKNFSKFSGPAGWKGSITTQPDGETYLSWYTDDCGKNKQTGSFNLNVDLVDKNANDDKNPANGKIIFTNKGTSAYKPDEIIRQGATPVPKFFASARQPGTDENPTPATLVGLVLPTDAGPGDTISGSLVTDPASYAEAPGIQMIELKTPKVDNLLIRAANSPFDEHTDHAATFRVPSDGGLALSVKTEHLAVPLATTIVHFSTRPASAPAPSGGSFKVMPVLVKGSLQVVEGPLTGSAVYTSLQAAANPAPILVETPRVLFWRVSDNVQPGPIRMRLVDGLSQSVWQAYVVSLKVSADRLQLTKGESTRFHIVVSGLEQMPADLWKGGMAATLTNVDKIRKFVPDFQIPTERDPGRLLLIVENATPANVTMDSSSGDKLQLSLDREAWNGHPFEYSGTIRALASGGFKLNAMLIPLFAPQVVSSAQIPNAGAEKSGR